MIATYFYLAVAVVLLATFAIIAVRRSRRVPSLEHAVAALHSLDAEAFRNLVDSTEEEFLRQRLPSAQFRNIKRERIRVALIYVSALSEISVEFARFGGAAQRSSDPAIAASAREIANSAVYLRLRAIEATARLTVALAFPRLRPHPVRSLIDQYDRASHLMVAHRGLTRFESRAS